MKEYLVKDKQTGKYYVDNNPASYDEAVEIPEGAQVLTGSWDLCLWWKGSECFCNQLEDKFRPSNWINFEDYLSQYSHKKDAPKLLWQRQSENQNPLFDINWFEGDLKEKKHNHYFKNVKHLDYVDVYRVLDLFEVVDPCIQHAIKKLLCAGMRGAKNQPQDVQEAIDSLVRYQEMRKEDRK